MLHEGNKLEQMKGKCCVLCVDVTVWVFVCVDEENHKV